MADENEPASRLEELRVMATRTRTESSDLVIADMIVKFADFIHATAKALDDTQHRVRRLNVWIAILSAIVAVDVLARLAGLIAPHAAP